MQIVLIILSAGLLGLIVYFAVSPKSSRLLKISALAALALSAVALGICGIFLIRGPGKGAVEIPFPFPTQASAEPAGKGNLATIIIFVAVFLTIMGIIIAIAMRDRRNPAEAGKKPEKKPAGQNSASPVPAGPDSGLPDDNFDDDSFDIGFE